MSPWCSVGPSEQGRCLWLICWCKCQDFDGVFRVNVWRVGSDEVFRVNLWRMGSKWTRCLVTPLLGWDQQESPAGGDSAGLTHSEIGILWGRAPVTGAVTLAGFLCLKAAWGSLLAQLGSRVGWKPPVAPGWVLQLHRMIWKAEQSISQRAAVEMLELGPFWGLTEGKQGKELHCNFLLLVVFPSHKAQLTFY